MAWLGEGISGDVAGQVGRRLGQSGGLGGLWVGGRKGGPGRAIGGQGRLEGDGCRAKVRVRRLIRGRILRNKRNKGAGQLSKKTLAADSGQRLVKVGENASGWSGVRSGEEGM